ncbi:Aste57867_14805 [Aphanomyces stellatus]|uniref:Aste57867_14805 protein n=1 Tax=Aphanomyces stellatus TaxID=120398 RepID=A0A485L273_9STRA|nr:hypothetical protein As57867_014750 [Aphanomyces stellatus]VFT91623.1 Aste57867_14805 [Aphanomyces stellatus]
MGATSSYVYKESTSLSSLISFMKDPRTALLDSRNYYGDVFLIESALVGTKIAGLCGPEALQQFEAKLLDGSLVKDGAFPPSIVDLLGPVMSTLDGDAHDRKKAAIVDALSPEKLALYKPIIRRIVQTEHAVWGAHGGSISIAVNTKELVFKVLMAVLYGLEGNYDAYRSYVDDFVASIKNSAKVADAYGLECRKQFVDEIINPALDAAKARAATNTSKASVLDFLVAANELSDEDIRTEGFHVMFAGFGGLATMTTNMVTAAVTHADARAKLFAARDEFVHKFGDDRWDHFESLGYANQFILEVKRVYVAGPTQTYAKATRDVEIVTKHGVFKIPKGTLVMAGLEATNKDPDVWTNPQSFDPDRFLAFDIEKEQYKFCPHSFGTAKTRRCAGEQLSTLVLQTVLVSYFDYVWKMIPNQDYSLEPNSVTAVPQGKLMAVGFQPNKDGKAKFGLAGTEEDWKFLRRPDVQELTGHSTTEYFDDSRLDLWTRLMIKLISKKQRLWNRPYANSALTIPKEQVELEKITLIQTNIQVPIVDEDWPCQPWLEIKQSNMLRDYAPFVDDFNHPWLPAEDGERYVMSKVGHMWPRVNVHWNDRYSDRALELFVFNGMASHLVHKLPQAHEDGSYYGVLLNFMQVLDVRPGFAKYGADAYFDKTGKIVKIQRGNTTYTKSDKEWEYVKMCFRGSCQTKVTAVDHLLGVHSTAANYLTTSSREQLPVNHPLRRLIKPFTFRSVSINYGAGRSLFWPNGMLQRAYALSTAGMKQVWDYGLSHFEFLPFPARIAKQQIDTLELSFHKDGLDYWNVVFNFVSDYVNLYFVDDAAVTGDNDVVNFWNYVTKVSPAPLPSLSKQSLKDFIAEGIFLVSSMHNHLGTIAEYVSDPAFCPSAWVEGELAARPGNAVRLALIMTATGFIQPAITEDFSHVLLDDAAKALARRFTADCFAFIKVVDERNTTRVQPFQSFNPKTMEMAVSI